MGNWQERIRQAQEGEIRTQAQRELYEEKSRRESIESAEREKKDAIAETNLLKEEFLPLMERLGARELLQQVRDEVWRVGEIDPEPRLNSLYTAAAYHDFCRLGLGFNYETAYEDIYTETIGSGARDAQGTRTFSRGWKRATFRTGTQIVIERTFAIPNEGRMTSSQAERLRYRQSFQGKPYGNYRLKTESAYSYIDVNIVFNPSRPEDSKKLLEEFLLKDCVERTSNNLLPFQLRKQGEMEISKHFPIQSFLKNVFGKKK